MVSHKLIAMKPVLAKTKIMNSIKGDTKCLICAMVQKVQNKKKPTDKRFRCLACMKRDYERKKKEFEQVTKDLEHKFNEEAIVEEIEMFKNIKLE